MPRYFIDTYDHIVCLDDEGHDLADRAALHRLVHRTLAEMLASEKERLKLIQLRVVVRDGSGATVLVSTLAVETRETF